MLRSLLIEERGTESVEWGLIAGLVVGGSVLVLMAVGVGLHLRMEGFQTELAV